MADYSKVIWGTHLFLPKAELRTHIALLKNRFTVRSKFDDRETPVFFEKKDWFGIPRYFNTSYLSHAAQVIDETTLGHPIDMQMKSELRDVQRPVFDQFVQSIAHGKTGVLLKAPTGFGKTVLMLQMIAHLGVTALIIVPRAAIISQWVDRILQHTNLTKDDIGIARQDKCDFEGKKIVVGMIHSLAKNRYPEEFKSYFGAVVWDEVHTAGADSLSTTLNYYPAKYRIGASATVDRKDAMEDIYKLHIAEVTLSPTCGTYVKPTVFLRSYTSKKKHPYLDKVKDSKSRRGVILSALGEDLARNALIAVYVDKFVKSGRRTLVLSDRTEQLDTLFHLLTGRHSHTPTKVGLFTGKTSKGERDRVLKHCDIILATYGVMAMAIDVPDLRALAYATPLSDVEQAVGRILRLCEGAKEPVVLDIVDETFKETQRWAYLRQDQYRKSGAKIIEVKA